MDNDGPRLVSVTERRKAERGSPAEGGRRLQDAEARACASYDKVGQACDALDALLSRAGG